MLVRRPSDSFDSSNVISKLSLRTLTVVKAPNQKLVIIASTCELLLIVGPLESTHLLLVSKKLSLKIMLSSEVAMQDALVS